MRRGRRVEAYPQLEHDGARLDLVVAMLAEFPWLRLSVEEWLVHRHEEEVRGLLR